MGSNEQSRRPIRTANTRWLPMCPYVNAVHEHVSWTCPHACLFACTYQDVARERSRLFILEEALGEKHLNVFTVRTPPHTVLIWPVIHSFTLSFNVGVGLLSLLVIIILSTSLHPAFPLCQSRLFFSFSNLPVRFSTGFYLLLHVPDLIHCISE
jgi:hypothetical protein